MDLFATRFNNKLPVCLTGSRPQGMGSGCTQSVLGRHGPICLPTSSHLGQSGGEVTGLPMQQNNTDCTGVAQYALVLGSSGHDQSDPIVSAHSAQSGDSAIQPNPAQEPVKPEPTCLAPRTTAIKGFSEAVAARIEAPQRGSTRSVYEAKWTIFTKWCLSNRVDFRAPPVKAIADFLLHLFQDRMLQPGTTDGYRSAIADKLGNSPINVSKDEHLTHLMDSFHSDRPKGRKGMPSWNLNLTGLRCLCTPHPGFLSKNRLAKEGPGSVVLVVIPALAPTLDKSLTGDRSLCPV